jgi:hypothetical protein
VWDPWPRLRDQGATVSGLGIAIKSTAIR